MTNGLFAVSVPPSWSLRPLGDLVDEGSDSGSPSEVPSFPFIGMENVESGTGRVIALASPSDYKSSSYIAGPGQVLYGRLRPYLNKVFIPDRTVYASREFIPLTPRKSLNPHFLLYLLRSSEFVNHAMSLNSGDRPRVKWQQIESCLIPYPPITEQVEIVRILEEQFSRLDAAAASIAAVRRKAEQFRRSLLNEAFSGEMTASPSGMSARNGTRNVNWEVHRLGDCLQKLKSGKLAERGWSPQCSNHPSSDEGSWGVLKTTAVQMGEFRPEHNKELPTTLTPKASLEVEDGDFLLITTSPRNRCGVVCQVKNTRKKLIFSGKILRFRVDEEKVLANWLMFYLMSPKSQEELDVLKVGTSDSSVSIGNSQILDLTIPVAPLEEQRLVTSLLDEEMARLDALLQAAMTAEIRVAALRRSLLMAAFSGELTREWREKNHG